MMSEDKSLVVGPNFTYYFYEYVWVVFLKGVFYYRCDTIVNEVSYVISDCVINRYFIFNCGFWCGVDKIEN
jgi:hypothetical protein